MVSRITLYWYGNDQRNCANISVSASAVFRPGSFAPKVFAILLGVACAVRSLRFCYDPPQLFCFKQSLKVIKPIVCIVS
jgi:hypothetical protein